MASSTTFHRLIMCLRTNLVQVAAVDNPKEFDLTDISPPESARDSSPSARLESFYHSSSSKRLLAVSDWLRQALNKIASV